MTVTTPLTGLYRPDFEKDSCGFGLIANIDDKPSHWLVRTSIEALARLTHRGAVAADGKSGDGCGLLLKKPNSFLRQKADESKTVAQRERTDLARPTAATKKVSPLCESLVGVVAGVPPITWIHWLGIRRSS